MKMFRSEEEDLMDVKHNPPSSCSLGLSSFVSTGGGLSSGSGISLAVFLSVASYNIHWLVKMSFMC